MNSERYARTGAETASVHSSRKVPIIGAGALFGDVDSGDL